MIPQGLVRAARDEHNRNGRKRATIRIRGLASSFLRVDACAPPRRAGFVGRQEVSGVCVTNVSNHPQSLWISLWTGFRRALQVTYRKGFFFDRSNFERRVFHVSDQGVTGIFPLEEDARKITLRGMHVVGPCGG